MRALADQPDRILLAKIPFVAFALGWGIARQPVMEVSFGRSMAHWVVLRFRKEQEFRQVAARECRPPRLCRSDLSRLPAAQAGFTEHLARPQPACGTALVDVERRAYESDRLG